MSFLLMVFLTVVCLWEGYPRPLWLATPGESALATVATVALVGLHAFWVSRRVCWPLNRDPFRRDGLLASYERWRFLHQLLQFGLFGLALGVFGWGWAVRELGPLPGVELLTLAPFLAGQILTWAFFYDADRAAHRAAHRLVELDPFGQTWLEPRNAAPTPFGGRWAYVAFQLRQKVAFVFLPVLLLISWQEAGRLFPASWAGVPLLMNLLAIGTLAAVVVGMPLLIRLALGLKPLPPGPLRDRLSATSRRLGFRCSDVLLWNTRSGMANAMVIGVAPWLRYVVFTDRLVEEFTEDEVEAVFGHEVGHIRHQHMLYYLLFLTGSTAALGLAVERHLLPRLGGLGEALAASQPWLPASLGDSLLPNGQLSLVPVILTLLAYIFVVFGYLSRRCERQADLFGCRAVSCCDPICSGHGPETRLAPKGRGLCRAGIRTFIRALDKVALVNGIDRERPGFLQSWQHSTIAKRVAFLRHVLSTPAAEPAFQRRLLVVKVGLIAALGLALGGLSYLHGWPW
ncbi:MAG: M48 family metallopeptidase [Gemmataceae bacterium]